MKLITTAFFASVALSGMSGTPSHFVPRHRSTVAGEISLQNPRAGKSALPVINDDYENARAQAIKRKLPLFVDVWAPW